jgi:hypothetical protein
VIAPRMNILEKAPNAPSTHQGLLKAWGTENTRIEAIEADYIIAPQPARRPAF